MVYGMESVILVKIRMSSFKTSNFDKKNNKIELRLNLDLFDEEREKELRSAQQCISTRSPNTTIKESSIDISCQATSS